LSAAKLAKKLNDRESSAKKNDENPAYYPLPPPANIPATP